MNRDIFSMTGANSLNSDTSNRVSVALTPFRYMDVRATGDTLSCPDWLEAFLDNSLVLYIVVNEFICGIALRNVAPCTSCAPTSGNNNNLAPMVHELNTAHHGKPRLS